MRHARTSSVEEVVVRGSFRRIIGYYTNLSLVHPDLDRVPRKQILCSQLEQQPPTASINPSASDKSVFHEVEVSLSCILRTPKPLDSRLLSPTLCDFLRKIGEKLCFNGSRRNDVDSHRSQVDRKASHQPLYTLPTPRSHGPTWQWHCTVHTSGHRESAIWRLLQVGQEMFGEK